MALIIEKLDAIEVLDSRGNPTIEAYVICNNEIVGKAQVPSGASTGKYEAHEKRDSNSTRYFGKGVSSAINLIRDDLNIKLKGYHLGNLMDFDQLLLSLDSSPQKSSLGGNTILALSLAALRAISLYQKTPVYKLIRQYVNQLASNHIRSLRKLAYDRQMLEAPHRRTGAYPSVREDSRSGVTTQLSLEVEFPERSILSEDHYTLPTPMFNILNGGMHAVGGIDIQEIMIVPQDFQSFAQKVEAGSVITQNLKTILKEKGCSVLVGDEGGFAPPFKTTREALETLNEAITKSGFTNSEVKIAIDSAASSFYENEEYSIEGKKLSGSEMIEFYQDLINDFNIISLEDPLHEEDLKSWEEINHKLGDKIYLVGDDLFVTNINRIKSLEAQKLANSILIKPNQVGTIFETLQTIVYAIENGMSYIVSHRSGETEDNIIADIAVGVGAPMVKFGAPVRSDRNAKYNRLLAIEHQLISKNIDYF